MDDVLKLIYANFLLTTQAKLGRGYPDWTGFVYDLVKDNYDIKDGRQVRICNGPSNLFAISLLSYCAKQAR